MDEHLETLQEVVRLLRDEWQRPAGSEQVLAQAALAGFHVAQGLAAEDAVSAVRDAEAEGWFPLAVLEAKGVAWYVDRPCHGGETLHLAWHPRRLHPQAALALIEAEARGTGWTSGRPLSDAWHWFLRRRPVSDPPEMLTGQLGPGDPLLPL